MAKTTLDPRNDSFDVQHYTISLDISNIAGKTISGNCRVSLKSKTDGLKKITLELYKLKVDSVLSGNQIISYAYNDSILVTSLSKAYSIGDTFSVQVFYHGQPKVDPTGFGGFAFSSANGGIAYNLGIAFKMNPHNVGRTWFPCVDDFTDKATYGFYIITQPTHKAFCGGVLKDSSLLGNGKRLWHWELEQPVPAYLASVAVSHYATVTGVYNSPTRKIPIQLAIYQADTAKAWKAFYDLPKVVKAFEEMFGPYPFDRIGYFEMPLSAGAMEHATNIAYPAWAVSGGTSYPQLWAHELSHHWWGDYMTCSSQEDMWLNEGWASYCEALFFEKMYGKEAYRQDVYDRHDEVVRLAHIEDSGYRAITPMPWAYTYGRHVYAKGGDVIHTLRGQMGDSLFFKGVKHFLQKFAWSSASTDDFKLAMEEASGLNLDAFFKTWLYSPGFPHFEVVYYDVQQEGNQFHVKNLQVHQRLKENEALFKNAKVVITFFDDKWNRIDKTITMDEWGTLDMMLPFKPVFVEANIDMEISDATLQDYKVVNKTGTVDFADQGLQIVVDQVKDSALFYLNYHLMPAERSGNLSWNIRISPDRYWTIDGIFPSTFQAHAVLLYDARKTKDPTSNGWLDNNLINDNEDSLKLMYREFPWQEWQEYPDYVKTMGSKTDKYGSIRINNLKRGQYALAMVDHTASIKPSGKRSGMNIYPNPAGDALNVALPGGDRIENIQLYDMQGKLVFKAETMKGMQQCQLQTSQFTEGMYVLQVQGNEEVYNENVVIRR